VTLKAKIDQKEYLSRTIYLDMWLQEVLYGQFIQFFGNKLEVAGFLLGVVSVYLVVKRNVMAFPIGIAMVACYAIVFYDAKLYSDMLLQVFFAVMQLAGWVQWRKSTLSQDHKIAVRSLSLRQIYLTTLIIILLTFLLGLSMDHYTDTDVPYADAFTTAVSIMAQWWLNARYLQNWHLWILVDVLYVFLYWYKGLYLTSVLYLVFLALAMQGFGEWRRWQKASL
jgi:nicotinamide mononucleotide transporter